MEPKHLATWYKLAVAPSTENVVVLISLEGVL